MWSTPKDVIRQIMAVAATRGREQQHIFYFIEC